MKKAKISIGILLVIIIVLIVSVLLMQNYKLNKMNEAKEQLTPQDGFITTKEHLELANTIENRFSDFRKKIAEAISSEGVLTTSEQTAEEMATNIRNISKAYSKVTNLGELSFGRKDGLTGGSTQPLYLNISELYSNYKNITIDNIIIQPLESYFAHLNFESYVRVNWEYNYNSETGLIECSTGNTQIVFLSNTLKCKVYIIE